MKQKIAVKVLLKCSKCKNKAMEKAAAAPGVISVAIDGDKIVVIGDEIDAVKLTKLLKKKFGFATLERVEEVKKDEKKEEPVHLASGYVMNPFHDYGLPYNYIHDPSPCACSIL